MKRIFALALATLTTIMAFAQKPTIKFDIESYDFGEILEVKGPVSHSFKFTNTGTTPLVITQVQASCGCTTPTKPQKPIRPGESDEITVTFNPAGRIGTFSKTITVSSNAEQANVMLRISGRVLEREKTLEDIYPYVMDSLRLKSNILSFTKIHPNETKTESVEVINTSASNRTPQFINIPKHITIECQPATIKPGETGHIVATYDASLKNDWGYVSDRVYVTFDGKRQYSNQMTLTASIEEDFSQVDAAEAPVIQFNERSHDFGQVVQGTKAVCDFIVTNNGKSPLAIRKVKASCGCTAVTPNKTLLVQGESTEIHVEFDTRGKSGRQSKTVTVISNDPKNSNILLRIQCNVLLPGHDMK